MLPPPMKHVKKLILAPLRKKIEEIINGHSYRRQFFDIKKKKREKNKKNLFIFRDNLKRGSL